MLIHFFLRYPTRFGQEVNMWLQLDGVWQCYTMTYHDHESWKLELNNAVLNGHTFLEYYYEIKDGDATFRDQSPSRFFYPDKFQASEVTVLDDWQDFHIPHNVFHAGAFGVLKVDSQLPDFTAASHTGRHLFQVDCILLKKEWVVCLLGSGETLHDWMETNPLLMRKGKGKWELELNFNDTESSVEDRLNIFCIKRVYSISSGVFFPEYRPNC